MDIIEVAGLAKSYRGDRVVEDVTFSVREGEVFGLLGPNGAGKTTTVECIGGLRRRDAGTVLVDGRDPAENPLHLRRTLGMQLQETSLPALMTVRQALDLFAGFYSDPADPAQLLARLGLEEKAGTRFEQLSGGQKQRLAVALALVGRPRVAVLDELTTGLDPSARREVWGLLEELRTDGTTLLLVSHFMEEVERLCDRVAVIHRGRVAALGTPQDLALGAAAEHRISFTLAGADDSPVDDERAGTVAAELRDLSCVGAVERDGGRITVRGGADVADAALGLIARHGLLPRGVALERGSLDDAYLALVDGADR